MLEQFATLKRLRQNYSDRLDILRQSRILYNKNKHRSVPHRGPYEYGLKVAQREFDHAREALQALLYTARGIRLANEASNAVMRETAQS